MKPICPWFRLHRHDVGAGLRTLRVRCACPRVALAVAFVALAFGCAKVPNDPNDPANPVWNRRDLHAPPEVVFTGPAIFLTPSIVATPPNTLFPLEIKALHFAGDVKGLHLVLALDPGVTYAARLDTLGFLGQDGGHVFGWAGARNDTLTVDLVRAGDPSASPADSGAIARLWFRATQAGQITFDQAASELRDGTNNPLPYLFDVRGAKVEVK